MLGEDHARPAVVSAARDKGTKAESAVVAFLRQAGFPHAERRTMRGSRDTGDIAGLPGIVIEVKDHAKMTLAEWVDEAHQEGLNEFDAQRARKGSVVSLVWHKRRGRASPGSWYVTMTGWDLACLLYAWTDAEKQRGAPVAPAGAVAAHGPPG